MAPSPFPFFMPLLFDIIDSRPPDYLTPSQATREDFWKRFSALDPEEQKVVRKALQELTTSHGAAVEASRGLSPDEQRVLVTVMRAFEQGPPPPSRMSWRDGLIIFVGPFALIVVAGLIHRGCSK